MATLSQETLELAAAVRDAMVALRTLVSGNASDLAALNTTAKGNLVAALNEVLAGGGGGGAETPIFDGAFLAIETDAGTVYVAGTLTNPS